MSGDHNQFQKPKSYLDDMNEVRKALEMALKALEGNCTNPVADPEQASVEDAAITALRQALETKQEPREREKVAAWMMAQGYATGHGDTVEDLLKELEWQIRESEREACAKVCETFYNHEALDCAEAIRARGEQ